MMRSLYSGVSGLQNHQTRMDVLGNNISNVNTYGFKKGRVTFKDMLSQSISSASAPTQNLGGINPRQVGLGMNIASIDTLHKQGSLQTTGNKTDLAITGEGFFVVKQGDNTFHTRAGDFKIDREGNLVSSNGLYVQGWRSLNGDDVNTTGVLENLNIPLGQAIPARATSNIAINSNLDKRTAQTDAPYILTNNVYDNFGNEHILNISFTPAVDGAGNPLVNTWTANVIINGEAPVDGGTFTLNFNNLGALNGFNGELLEVGAQATLPITFNVPLTNEGEGETQTFDLNFGRIGDYANALTQFANDSSVRVSSQNGYRAGSIIDFSLDERGFVTGIGSNGASRIYGQLALSSFINAGGLEKLGDNLYRQSNNSGLADIGVVASNGKGNLASGTLEMSNVDLSEEFTDMIVTQRGFQASSKTINTADQMLQELLNLKRT